jgi:hypothetical protein
MEIYVVKYRDLDSNTSISCYDENAFKQIYTQFLFSDNVKYWNRNYSVCRVTLNYNYCYSDKVIMPDDIRRLNNEKI